MRQLLTISLSFAMVVFISCAHKAAPLSKDRLSPKLLKVIPLNNKQIQFTFSENIDTLNLRPEHFGITSEKDTLKITNLYPSLSASEIIAITEPQFEIVYKVSGYVFDTAQNKGKFTKSFSGTSTPDTIDPWAVNYSKGKNQREFSIVFSEAIDTTFFEYYVLPKKNLKPIWQNPKSCFFVPESLIDSLHYDTTYYLYNKGMQDLSGNSINPFITSITPDTIYEPMILKGTVQVNDTLVKTGLAVLKKEYPIGIAFIENGRFAFEVRDSLTYIVDVISDAYSGSAEVSVKDENIIPLQLEEKDIDNLIN